MICHAVSSNYEMFPTVGDDIDFDRSLWFLSCNTLMMEVVK